MNDEPRARAVGAYAYEANQALESARAANRELLNQVEYLTNLTQWTGLTTNELQGIHKLIKGQIDLISVLQTSDDALKIHSAVTPLAILVSLVSKPID